MIQDNTFYKSLADYRIPKETRFAPVVPLSIAAELSDSNTLGNYHLLLAHDVLANPREYAEIYGNKGYTILMDNSLIELGYAMPIEEVLDAANIVGGQYIILPDTLKQADTTIQQVLNAYIVWKGIPAAKKHGVSLLPVIQGMSMREQFDCLFAFSNIPDVKGMCVPRVIADTYGTRKYLIEKVTRTFNVHMLGFSDNLMDDIACARMPGVVGIDFRQQAVRFNEEGARPHLRIAISFHEIRPLFPHLRAHRG